MTEYFFIIIIRCTLGYRGREKVTEFIHVPGLFCSTRGPGTPLGDRLTKKYINNVHLFITVDLIMRLNFESYDLLEIHTLLCIDPAATTTDELQ